MGSNTFHGSVGRGKESRTDSGGRTDMDRLFAAGILMQGNQSRRFGQDAGLFAVAVSGVLEGFYSQAGLVVVGSEAESPMSVGMDFSMPVGADVPMSSVMDFGVSASMSSVIISYRTDTGKVSPNLDSAEPKVLSDNVFRRKFHTKGVLGT